MADATGTDKPAKTTTAKPPVKSTAKTPAKPKVGIIARARQYLREVVYELKKVHWPTRKELFTYTAVVLVSVSFMAVLTWIVDSVLTFSLNMLLGS